MTKKYGTRLDFISFHAKGTGWPLPDKPFEMPSLQMIISYLDNYHSVLQKYPQLKRTEILFDECDMAVATNLGVYDFPEFNINNTEYFPIFVIRMAKQIMDYLDKKNMPVKLFTTWAFYFEGKRFFEGNRALFTNENIKKPIFNAFTMLEMLGKKRVEFHVEQNLSRSDFAHVDGISTVNEDHSVSILIWNFSKNPEETGEDKIRLICKNLPFNAGAVSIEHFQICRQNSNSYSQWQSIGAPQDPGSEQIAKIKEKENLQLIECQKRVEVQNQQVILEIILPRQSVRLIKIRPFE